jgi:hypothetical protein
MSWAVKQLSFAYIRRMSSEGSFKNWSGDSSVSVVTRNSGWIPGRGREYFVLQRHKIGSEARPVSCAMGTEDEAVGA